MLYKHVIIWCSVLWFYLQHTSAINSHCQQCTARSLGTELDDCFCDDEQFCNNSYMCEKCGYCFHFWNNITDGTKDDIFTLVKTIIENYDVDVTALQKMIQNIFENISEAEKALPKIDSMIDKVDDNNVEVLKKIEELRRNLELVKETLELFKKGPVNTEELITSIKKIKDEIDQIFNNISKIEFNPDIKDNLRNLTLKLDKIRLLMAENITFPNLHNNSLNLALDLESNIIFLESIISKYADHSGNQDPVQYNEALKSLDNDIKALQSFVVNIVSDYLQTFNYINEVKELKTYANWIHRNATEIDINLRKLLVEEKRFRDLLELSREAKLSLEEILHLKTKLTKINEHVRDLDELVELFQETVKKVEEDLSDMENQFFEQVTKYEHDKETLDAKLQKLQEFEPVLEKLLQKVLIQKEAIEQLDEIPTIDELENEIENMSKRADKYIAEILKYCRVESIQALSKELK